MKLMKLTSRMKLTERLFRATIDNANFMHNKATAHLTVAVQAFLMTWGYSANRLMCTFSVSKFH